ncbi:MAG: sigma-54 dependent transcriptional regulator [Saprospiraceae bacterium]
MQKILIIDDDIAVCKSLELLLRKSKYDVKSISHPSAAMDVLYDFQPQLVLLDMNFTVDTSGRQGMKMLQRIMEYDSSIVVILITGWATLQLAVEGMKNGAKDFLAKPWENKHLLSSIKTALSLYGKDSMSELAVDQGNIIGHSTAIKKVLQTVERVSSTNASVLITGESGTGKEIIAEAIHAKSTRSDYPFVKVNLGGISTSLFESEMFGHVRGAFTDANADRSGRFEKAHTGTIFLDEIGDLAFESQVKLLRVLQEKSYEVLGSSKTIKTDVRVICATHKPLEEMVGEGIFREDLYYRINLIQIRLPALSERREDIPLLVDHFVHNVSKAYEIDMPYIADEAIKWLSEQTYSGNIRQLKNIVERTILMALNSKELGIEDFQNNMMMIKRNLTKITLPNIGEMTLDELECGMIKKALAYHNHSISKTSRSLGLTRSSLYRRIEKYDIR